MPKQKTFALILAAFFACFSHAQSPTDGHIAGKSYVNSYFHIAYTWPVMLRPMDLPALSAAPNNPSAYAFPLFTARQGDQPYGVVVVAEKLNVVGPHSAGIKTSGDFVDRIEHTLRPGPILSNIVRSQKKNARGMIFDVLNYQQSGKPSSVIATQVGQYLIVFKCNAQSAADMVQMENSALALRNLK
jgi:hypothetical protein